MSILKSTHTGYKYYFGKEIVKRCCEFQLNGKVVDPFIEVDENGYITIKPCENQSTMKVYSQIVNREPGMPMEWFTTTYVRMLMFIGPSEDCWLVIKQPPEKLKMKELFVNVRIECEIPNIEELFKNVRINGAVVVSDDLQDIYPKTFLYTNRICSYFGKEEMGF